MPNWCSNTLVLQHDSISMIERARTAFERGELLQEFIPVPQELSDTVAGSSNDPVEQELIEAKQAANRKKYGHATWYDFCVSEWGTKWDIGANGGAQVDDQGRMLTLSFESAWSPPVAAYEKLEEQGFRITAMYYEPGMGYCGMYDEHGDEYYDLSDMNSEEVADLIPLELDSEFGISETMAEYERENEDEVTSWYKDGVEATGLEPHKVPKND